MTENSPRAIQKHGVTDLVLSKLSHYSQLNPFIKPGEDPLKIRERKFNQKLQAIVNKSNIVPFNEGKGENVDLFQLTDTQGKRIPILIKVVKPDRQDDADNVEMAHKTYVDLLGPEFVEDMSRVTITNEQILSTYKKGRYKDQKSLEAFVQDLRGLDKKESLYKYLLEHDYTQIPTIRKAKIKLFFQRVIDAFAKGYTIDLGVFPESLEDMIETDFRANLLIDSEGVSLIDSGLILRNDAKQSLWQSYLIDLKIACQLFAGKIKAKEAFKIENNWLSAIQKLKLEHLEIELNKLRDLLKTVE